MQHFILNNDVEVEESQAEIPATRLILFTAQILSARLRRLNRPVS